MGLKNQEKFLAPFCDEELQDCSVKEENLCCDMQDIINDNGMRVCRSCGVVHDYDFTEYIDFYQDMRWIRYFHKSMVTVNEWSVFILFSNSYLKCWTPTPT